MKIPMAFVADEANVSQEGKLNVLGIFDRIMAGEMPLVHPRMVFCFRVLAEPGDVGRMLPVQVRLVDEAGEPMFEASGEMVTPMLPPGEVFSANQVFTLVGVQFPRPGTYRFTVAIGDAPPHETPLHVGLAPTPTAGELN
jgi:hypothetical protein